MDGDGSAFASLFKRYRDRVFVHSLRLVKTPFEAEDVTAMVFLEAWRCRSKIRLVNDSMLGWLLVTATNVARNKLRSTLRYERLLRKFLVPGGAGSQRLGSRHCGRGPPVAAPAPGLPFTGSPGPGSDCALRS
ncbi:RNA polymerase sigma factor [Arthrobacter ipis]|uniref:RNA polymerase sigma factor n=1 Tax=Arthrobacter ipis TaxID=2716202 RepID=UPI001FE546F2|nr:sigma-70 family RNA polymerase sigma factor [Arthrobacter ipis]